MRKLVLAVALAVFVNLGTAQAQTYPTRPVRLIAPAPAGGITDLYARLIAQLLSERLGQSFFVENRPGAGANIGTEAVLRAAPDGYTLLQVSSQNAWAVGLYDKLNFDLLRDLIPVASIYRAPSVMLIHPSLPTRTVSELIAYAKANPGKLNMASGGMASSSHVYGELFKMMAGVDMTHIPYRGGGLAMTDLLAGHVPFMIDSIGTSMEHVKNGKLRALAVTSLTRAAMLPDVPTIAEFVPGYEGIGWQGVAAPRNTSAEIVARLNKEINAGLDDPRIKARIAELGADVFQSSPTEFETFVASYTETWRNVIRAANIKPD